MESQFQNLNLRPAGYESYSLIALNTLELRFPSQADYEGALRIQENLVFFPVICRKNAKCDENLSMAQAPCDLHKTF